MEEELNKQFTGLMTPSKGLIYAVLNSYAEKDGGSWVLRKEDLATARREEMKTVFTQLEEIGKRLEFKTTVKEKTLIWLENGKPVRKFHILASALIHRIGNRRGTDRDRHPWRAGSTSSL
ncbi:MAG: hypothetical protein IPJ47_13665 [Anaerolineales bacterium]|nr:hypothetical protein [Anaerolineales bacterium]